MSFNNDSTVINIVQVLESDIGIYRLYILYEEGEPLFASGTVMFEPHGSKDSKACLNSSVALNCLWLSREGYLWAVDVMGNVYTCANIAFESAPNIATFASGKHHLDWVSGNICTNALTHISGTTNNDVWVAGTAGLVMHWDGHAWTDHSLETQDDIMSLAYDSGELYITTRNGLYHFQGDTWFQIDLSQINGLDPLIFIPVCTTFVSSGSLVVCSRHGQIIEGTNKTGFNLIHEADVPWYGVSFFKDALYLAGGPAGVFRYQDQTLECVKPKGDPVDLSDSENTLYFIPAKQESGPWYFTFQPDLQSEWKQVAIYLR
ncbi:hypothetical protein A3715_15600 [Oleiphilus sp. HI0009]|nr:hypothetical protein A3715_15600 [Oleiphilus sp. HI0009]